MFTGLKDVDRLILRKIDSEEDLANVFRVNKYAYSFYNDDKFWIARFFDHYEKYLYDINVLDYKKNKSWRKYYTEVTKAILTYFPYFISALYMDDNEETRRYDILTLLERIRKIQHVKKVYLDFGGHTMEEYFTRDGKINGIREGYGVSEQIIDEGLESKIERVYRNGFTLEEIYSENGKIKRYKEFFINDVNSVSKNIEFSSKGATLLREVYIEDSYFKQVEKYFANGDMKAQGVMFKNKKHGEWNFWNKKGELQVKKYNRDKLVKGI